MRGAWAIAPRPSADTFRGGYCGRGACPVAAVHVEAPETSALPVQCRKVPALSGAPYVVCTNELLDARGPRRPRRRALDVDLTHRTDVGLGPALGVAAGIPLATGNGAFRRSPGARDLFGAAPRQPATGRGARTTTPPPGGSNPRRPSSPPAAPRARCASAGQRSSWRPQRRSESAAPPCGPSRPSTTDGARRSRRQAPTASCAQC